ncbi:hypothetical protein [Bacillus gaemokensis]|uniref:Uncharacterized protein n=1 Tax=Bacillus gaemokensis TaxID=574375 RepID=A0A073KNA2_9BACI|nr:hypothetical protein [Bacillus gaemokensis]KEK23858.1 hypothetical protein BAGA_05280 [Bacillus gaemokensis]KYG38098.1 hypothetical protein AZF08_20320 [Bacillus gaemokensis]
MKSDVCKIVPITVNGEEKIYITDAPYEMISKCFLSSFDFYDFLKEIKISNYNIRKYTPSMSLNFDEK